MALTSNQKDLDALNKRDNPEPFEEGFEQSDTDFFFDLNDTFTSGNQGNDGQSGNSAFGGGQGGSSFGGQGGNSAFGGQGGNSAFGGQGGNSAFGGQNQSFGGQFGGMNGFGTIGPTSPFPASNGLAVNGQEQKKDYFDVALDSAVDASKNLYQLLIDFFKSVKLRTADEIGEVANYFMRIGGIVGIGGFAIGLIGQLAKFRVISFHGFPLDLMFAGILTLASGMFIMGLSAMYLAKMSEKENLFMLEQCNDVQGSLANELEAKSGSFFEDAIASDFAFDLSNNSSSDEDEFDIPEYDPDPEPIGSSHQDMFVPSAGADDNYNPSEMLEEVPTNTVITRETLVNTFVPLLKKCTPRFMDVEEIDENDPDWTALRVRALKAVANAMTIPLEELPSDVALCSACRTVFAYDLRVTRVLKLKNIDTLKAELEVSMADLAEKKDDSKNKAKVSVVVELESDYFHIIVMTGKSSIVSLGDVMNVPEHKEYFMNPKRRLPMLLGVDSLGNVMIDDASGWFAMMITGKPRSGKSWFVALLLIELMIFNTPEDVQFLIIDPKESNFFNTLSLMPHVAGLHNHKNILNIMDDIINIEGPRRKKMMADAEVEDIWGLIDKGIKVPILYLFIDEVMTVINELSIVKKDKDFKDKLNIIISQYPSSGIRVIIIPHRATGLVDKTTRGMFHFTASIMGDTNDVLETLGIKKWDKALISAGDIAFKSSTYPEALYMRGAVITDSNEQTSNFIKTAAKAFYKMGVDLPDMSGLGCGYNRDEDKIREKLMGEGKRVQYSASNILNDLDTIELDPRLGADALNGLDMGEFGYKDKSASDDDVVKAPKFEWDDDEFV